MERSSSNGIFSILSNSLSYYTKARMPASLILSLFLICKTGSWKPAESARGNGRSPRTMSTVDTEGRGCFKAIVVEAVVHGVRDKVLDKSSQFSGWMLGKEDDSEGRMVENG